MRSTAPTFPEFCAAAEFVRRAPALYLYVRWENQLFTITPQKRGRLTTTREAALRSVFDAYSLGMPPVDFFAKLESDLAALRKPLSA